MKLCSRCNIDKPDEEFYFHKRHLDGMNSYCIPCTKQASADWYAANKDKAGRRSRDYHIKRCYGLTAEQYDELFDKQHGYCAICQRHQDTLKFSLAVDHNHKTGAIRGLLCINCNHRLVGRHTDGTLLRAMADYVEQDTGWFVPPKPKKRRRKTVRKDKNARVRDPGSEGSPS